MNATTIQTKTAMKTKHLLATGLLALTASFTPARAADIILHNFTGGASDGLLPEGSLTLSGATLYGMTGRGGGSGGDYGTIFNMHTDGSGFGLLHRFASGASDGGYPSGSLTLAGATLYGLTQQGGSSGQGTVFSMNTDGSGFGLLHSFTSSSSDGGQPYGSLTLSGAKLYGMTITGGTIGAGTVFSMNTDGSGFGLLHSFTNGADGGSPFGSLTLSGAKLYGMARGGGSGNNGTLFSMNTDGSGFALLHTFAGTASDGRIPQGSLTLSGVKLYGMTNFGGSSDQGTLFSMNTDGSGFGLLQTFGGAPGDGALPTFSDVTLSGDASTLYGMTQYGGTANGGRGIFAADA